MATATLLDTSGNIHDTAARCSSASSLAIQHGEGSFAKLHRQKHAMLLMTCTQCLFNHQAGTALTALHKTADITTSLQAQARI